MNDLPPTPGDRLSIEVNVRKARQSFGDALPKGHLSDEELKVYERLYGTPIFVETAEELQDLEVVEDVEEEVFEEQLEDGSTVLLRKGEDGELEEVEVFEEVEEELVDEEEEGESMTEEEWEALRERKAQNYHDNVYEESRKGMEEDLEEGAEEGAEEEEDEFMRAHPLTIAGRFKPSPSTVFLPKETLVDPIAQLLTRANHKHLAESSNRILGGPGLPFSASTPAARLGKEQKPIPLDPSDATMGNIEADVYMASVQPGTYASVMGSLVEVRRRLGSSWIENLITNKKGGMVLDAGSGGVGVLAWQEVLKADWERMQEESGNTSRTNAPLGKATVLTAPDTLRHRASRLLENTTFIPRLPDSAAEEEEVNTQQPRKLYDLIIAPHTLWGLKQEYLRKEQVQKYWSLLNPKGGVLVLIEKGLPRGFEVVAAARELLLDKHIASPDSKQIEMPLEEQVSKPNEDTQFVEKETGMIIAPCTNHGTCPMYQSPGISHGRKDFCFFSQRYIRPPYLQRILNATDRNHEDIQYSYLAVQRGRDQRLAQHDTLGKGFMQGEAATDAAFSGHEYKPNPEAEEGQELDHNTAEDVNPLTLPRLILPALKRRGHIILDVCTPAATLERWTVPRSFSRQAFRDARKARWGDLWALGAKTRIPRNVRLGRPRDEFDRKGRRIKTPKKVTIQLDIGSKGDEAVDKGARVLSKGRGDRDGRYSADRKIRGSGGRKGRKKSVEAGNEDLLD
ncbi:37S ribosomal protein S22 [Paraconiothyrium brasiliense]|uniref:37S ribosomal protein S22 n=1 Tax=Paraconiothyrium brasiliense TaxID=300254 RepID=A0ABR3S926_9PLEO